MFFDDFRRMYMRKLDERIAKTADYMADGKAANIEEYRKLAGTIAGLRMAKAEFIEAVKTEVEDEDEQP